MEKQIFIKDGKVIPEGEALDDSDFSCYFLQYESESDLRGRLYMVVAVPVDEGDRRCASSVDIVARFGVPNPAPDDLVLVDAPMDTLTALAATWAAAGKPEDRAAVVLRGEPFLESLRPGDYVHFRPVWYAGPDSD